MVKYLEVSGIFRILAMYCDWDVNSNNTVLWKYMGFVLESEGCSSTSSRWKVLLLCCGDESGSKHEIFLIVGSIPTNPNPYNVISPYRRWKILGQTYSKWDSFSPIIPSGYTKQNQFHLQYPLLEVFLCKKAWNNLDLSFIICILALYDES